MCQSDLLGKELEEENCKLTGDQRKKHLEEVGRQYRDERKQQAASLKMYMLIASIIYHIHYIYNK